MVKRGKEDGGRLEGGGGNVGWMGREGGGGEVIHEKNVKCVMNDFD